MSTDKGASHGGHGGNGGHGGFGGGGIIEMMPVTGAMDAGSERRGDKDYSGRFAAPKGLYGSAQGFNPGNHPIMRFALKGREIIRWWAHVISVYGVAPLAGRMVGVRRFPGLKPRAESYSPFGASELSWPDGPKTRLYPRPTPELPSKQ